MDKQEFIEFMFQKINSLVLPQNFRISVCIAQACCESKYGTSEIYENANNCFGIKCRTNLEDFYEHKSFENINGTYVVVS